MPAHRPPSGKGLTTGEKVLLLSGSTYRAAYGIGALLAPATMVAHRLAPLTHELDDPRLLLRAFGGHQLVAGCLAVASRNDRTLARTAAALGLLIDTLDVTSAVLEHRARGERDATVIGGYLISGSGMAFFASTLLALSR